MSLMFSRLQQYHIGVKKSAMLIKSSDEVDFRISMEVFANCLTLPCHRLQD